MITLADEAFVGFAVPHPPRLAFMVGDDMNYEQHFDPALEAEKANLQLPMCTDEQLAILDAMMDLVTQPPSITKIISVNSPAGGGKTFLLNLGLSLFRSNGKHVLAMATTGIAAILLAGGSTAHSRFGIPVPVDNTSVSNVKASSQRAQVLKEAEAIIWDEVTMADKMAIECVDRLLREIMAVVDPALASVPFGGKLIVFSGI